MVEMDMTKNWLDKEIKVFLEKLNEGREKIYSLIKYDVESLI